jgi:hypothetical protein
VAAVDRLSQLDRKAVRDRFDLRHSAKAMAQRYEVLYDDLARAETPTVMAGAARG